MFTTQQLKQVQQVQRNMLSVGSTNGTDDWLTASLPLLTSLSGTEAVYLIEPERMQPVSPGEHNEKDALSVKSPTMNRQFGDGLRDNFVGHDHEGYLLFKDSYITQQHRIIRYFGENAVHDAVVYDLRQWHDCRLYSEAYQPVNIERQMALSVPLRQGGSLLGFGYQQSNVPALGAECHQLLDLLLPAFEANVHFRQCSLDRYAVWTTHIDETEEALAVFSVDGKEYYRNTSLRELLSTEPLADALVEALRLFGAQLQTLATPQPGEMVATSHNVLLGGHSYRLRGYLDRFSQPIPTLIVAVERVSALPIPAWLRSAFNLTHREVTVTHLLVRGLTDREVAQELFISLHTARRHSENILRKLGISSRAGIAHHCRQVKGKNKR